MGKGTWRQPDMEQERPSSTADVWRSAGYKPMVKSQRVERESEGPIVPLRPGETREEGRGPAWVALVAAGADEGMVS
jgi:hypothetical protein